MMEAFQLDDAAIIVSTTDGKLAVNIKTNCVDYNLSYKYDGEQPWWDYLIGLSKLEALRQLKLGHSATLDIKATGEGLIENLNDLLNDDEFDKFTDEQIKDAIAYVERYIEYNVRNFFICVRVNEVVRHLGMWDRLKYIKLSTVDELWEQVWVPWLKDVAERRSD